ncbi:MAG: branched-chain amino acid ABC transporter permease [Chloroflexi bacterium]|nr:branched-chain amino acid ABC transporter permease [Chloroflexota bacterium]
MSGQRLKTIGVGLLLLLLLALPQYSGSEYYVHLANMVGISMMLTLSLNLIFGYTGQISVGHAGFYAIGAYTTAILLARFQMPFWLAVPASIAAAGLAGAMLGLPALRLKGYYLAVATLGFAVVVYVVLQQWRPVTGGAMGIIGIPRPRLLGYEFANESSYYYLVLVATLFTFFVIRNIIASPAGRAMIAIRESEPAAESLGIDVTKYKMVAFIVSSGLAGLAGSLFAPLARFVGPDAFTLIPSVVILEMLVIGGLGSHLGALIGGALMVLLPEFIGFVGGYRVFVYSLCLLFVIVFAPEGLAGMIHQLFAMVGSRVGWLQPQAGLEFDHSGSDTAAPSSGPAVEKSIEGGAS